MLKKKILIKLYLAVFCSFISAVSACAESCSSTGAIEYAYTAGGCSYTTQKRTCCSNGSWSAWDAECCPASTCWNGKECERLVNTKSCVGAYPGVVGGVFTRSATGCNSGSGWSYTEWEPSGCSCGQNKWSYKDKACLKCAWGSFGEVHNTVCPDGNDSYAQAKSQCEGVTKQFVQGETSSLDQKGVEISKSCTVTRCSSPKNGSYRYVWSVTFRVHQCTKVS